MATAVPAKGGAGFHRLRGSLLLRLVGLFLGATVLTSSAQVPPPARPLPGTTRHRPDRVIIKPKPGSGQAGLDRWRAARGHRVLRRFAEAGDMQVVQLPPGMSMQEALAQYRQSGWVEFAEPDYIVRASVTPNDPHYTSGLLWALNNTGQSGGVSDADIDAPEGWATLHSATNIVVAVVDSGIRYTHEDLAGNMWTNPGEIPGNGIDDDRNGFIDDVHGINAITNSGEPNDDNGHGTHVAGTLGAVGNNGKGIVGVAWQVQIMACKFLDSNGDGEISDAVECIDYARRHGAKIINASWGGPDSSFALQSALNSARNAGIIVVAAAGNEKNDNDVTPNYPSSYTLDNIVAVTATTRADVLDATFADYGLKSVDLGAPGTSIYSAWHTSDRTYSYLSGTSMAAPHVAGALALLSARFANETYKQLITRLLAATDPLPGLAGKCVTGGRLNLDKALGPSVIADFTATPLTGSLPLTVRFTNTSFGTIVTQAWDFGDNTPLSSELNPVHVFKEEGNFTVTLTSAGTNGLTASKSRVISVIANYRLVETNFNWIDPGAMPPLTLTDNGISPAQSLPFPFVFYGQSYSQVYVAANGVMGFASAGLGSTSNSDLPSPALPNAVLAPYWDNLNPAGGGTVHIGLTGEAPERRAVVSWVEVPRNSSPTTFLTFQAVLHESTGHILFQYLEVYPDHVRGAGRRATVGLENETGQVAAKYAYNGVPALLTNRQALLWVPSTSGGMIVTPEAGLAVSGNQGGPFAPASQTYTIKNTGSFGLNWAVANSQSWITLSVTNGALASGQSTNVTVTIDPSAELLNPGSYLETLSFVNLNNGNGNTTRSVNLGVDGTLSLLEITPALGLSAGGFVGGPFAPASRIYTLINSGDATLSWTAGQDQDWISLSAAGGSLRPGESATLMVSISPSANDLPANSYTGRVDVVNVTSGNGNDSRAVTLLVEQGVRLSALPVSSPGEFVLHLAGEPGRTYVLQASTNLLDWRPVFTNSPAADGAFDFTDAEAGTFGQRFYRGVELTP
ncbi:MAG: S8 family serine peptidase [Chloroflexi bacterium]|nr:S8 family serine peptidase [Chloroflexota bacterium]